MDLELIEDSLTCAYDKASFTKYVDFLSKEEKHNIMVACVRINHLKYIWDHYSLPTGDNCVVLVAARLKKVVKEVFRVAVDEFILFISEENMEAVRRLDEVTKLIPTLYFESGRSILTVSVGKSNFGMAQKVDGLLGQAADRMNGATVKGV